MIVIQIIIYYKSLSIYNYNIQNIKELNQLRTIKLRYFEIQILNIHHDLDKLYKILEAVFHEYMLYISYKYLLYLIFDGSSYLSKNIFKLKYQ